MGYSAGHGRADCQSRGTPRADPPATGGHRGLDRNGRPLGSAHPGIGGGGTPQRMPGHKPTSPPVATPRPRRPRLTNFARQRGTPTQRSSMPSNCARPVRSHWPAGRSSAPARSSTCRCPQPSSPRMSTWNAAAPSVVGATLRRSIGGVVVGQSRLGSGLVALIATLREEARLPYRAIQRLLASVYDLHLSVGGLRGARAPSGPDGPAGRWPGDRGGDQRQCSGATAMRPAGASRDATAMSGPRARRTPAASSMAGGARGC